jgi:hypothetical protein
MTVGLCVRCLEIWKFGAIIWRWWVRHALKFPVTFGTAITERRRLCTQPRLGFLHPWSRTNISRSTGPIASRDSLSRKGVSHIDPRRPPWVQRFILCPRILFLPSTYKDIRRTRYLLSEHHGRYRKIWRNLNRYASSRRHRRWGPTSSFPQFARLRQT